MAYNTRQCCASESDCTGSTRETLVVARNAHHRAACVGVVANSLDVRRCIKQRAITRDASRPPIGGGKRARRASLACNLLTSSKRRREHARVERNSRRITCRRKRMLLTRETRNTHVCDKIDSGCASGTSNRAIPKRMRCNLQWDSSSTVENINNIRQCLCAPLENRG